MFYLEKWNEPAATPYRSRTSHDILHSIPKIKNGRAKGSILFFFLFFFFSLGILSLSLNAVYVQYGRRYS